MSNSVSYRHDLGNGLFLDAFSVDPKITPESLREIVASKDGKPEPDLEKLVSDTIFIERVNSVEDIGIEILPKKYAVPGQLQVFRESVQFQSDSVGRYNGPILIVDEKVQVPLRAFRGGFYDFVSTKLDTVPSDLERESEILSRVPSDSLFWKTFLNSETTLREVYKSLSTNPNVEGLNALKELSEDSTYWRSHCKKDAKNNFVKAGGLQRLKEICSNLKGRYEQAKTIVELLDTWGISHDKRARYLGFAYIALTDNGRELSFVQRAKGMAIAADCISCPGSTPNPPFNEPGLDINEYLRNHMIEEMSEEYNLSPDEFFINHIYLFDDNLQVPFGAVEMVTPLKTRELAERIYGKEGAIKEHPVLYSIKPEAIPRLIERFPIFPPFAQVMRVFDRHRAADYYQSF